MKSIFSALVSSFVALGATVAHAAWYNPFSSSAPPQASFVPTADALPELSKRQLAVVRGEQIFFVDQGYVFETRFGAREAVLVKDSNRVRSVILYKDIVVALQTSGDIFILAESNDSRAWVFIGNNAQAIAADDRDLYALVRSGVIWVYKGQPGPVVVTYTPSFISLPCGFNCSTQMPVLVPYIGGNEVAFKPTSIVGVTELLPNGEDGRSAVSVRKNDGAVESLR